MSKSIGFRSILTIPEFSHLNERDLLEFKYDALVHPYLYELGIDTTHPIEILVSNYRDLDDNTGIGYRYTGEVRRDAAFKSSRFCQPIDRIVMMSYEDRSMAHELAGLMSQTMNMSAFDGDDDEDIVPSDINEEYAQALKEIAALQSILFSVRGSQHNDAGAVKMSDEYLVEAE